jgi:creatine kinase/arginine kinase
MAVVTSPVGAFASDPDAYNVFNFIFNPLIEILHFFRKSDTQPESQWGEACKLPELDPRFVKTIRVSCRRNVEGFPFSPIMNFDQYEDILDKLACAAKCLCGSDLKGKLYPFEGMSDEDHKMFVQNGLMFSNDDECLQAANIYRFWPTGRAIFINDSMNFSILCNQQDHFKFIGIDFNGNLSELN